MRRLTSTVAALALLTGAAGAQAPITLDVDPNASQFTYGGTTSIGPIVGNPPGFGFQGSVEALFTGAAAAPPGTIALGPGGSVLVTPDIAAAVPNPIPGFPPLATVAATGVTFTLASAAAPIDAAGNVNLLVVGTVTSGTLTITPIVGAPTVTDLTGTVGTPQPFAGNVSVVGNSTRLSGPVSVSLPFMDSGSGIGGTIDVTGTFAAESIAAAPAVFCTSNPNSSGGTATLGATGSPSLSAADLVVNASGLPTNQFLLFIVSETPDFVPLFANSQGNLCVGGSIIRLNALLQNSGASGAASLPVPYGAVPGGSLDAGETWYFQAWFRDVSGGMATSNTTDGLEVTFAP